MREKKKYWLSWIIPFLFLGFFSTLGAQKTILLSGVQAGDLSMAGYIEVLEDPGGLLTITDVAGSGYSKHFKPTTGPGLNMGFSPSAYWLRLRIKNDTNIRMESPYVLDVGYYNFYEVDFYHLSRSGKTIKTVSTGIMRPAKDRDYPHHGFAFLFQVPQDSSNTVYVRFKSDASMNIAPRLFTIGDFLVGLGYEIFIMGLFIGILLIMGGYNTFLFFSLKDKSYLYFSLAISAILAFYVIYNGLAPFYIWPDQYHWFQFSLFLAASFVGVAFLLFTDNFLIAKDRIEKWHRVMLFMMGLIGLNILFYPFFGYAIGIKITLILLVISGPLTIFAGIYSFRGGYRPAGYFILSYSGLIIGSSLIILARFGLMEDYGLVKYGFIYGSMFLVLLMSFALADRIKILRRERERVGKDLIQSENNLVSLLNATSDVAFMVDRDYKIIALNDAFTKVVEIERENLLGYNALDLLPKRIREERKVKMDLALLSGEHIRWEDSGVMGWSENSAFPVKDEDGKVTSLAIFSLDISERKRAENLQKAVYQIARAAEITKNPRDLYRAIHHNIMEIMDANNFYIAQIDKKKELIRFPYYVDENTKSAPERKPRKGWTEYVINSGKSHLVDVERHKEAGKRGKVELLGKPSAIWLGVPLIVDDKTIGMMAVQHYSNPDAYGDRELRVMEFVSGQVAQSIEKKQTEERISVLSQAIEQSPVLIAITDVDGDIEYINQKFSNVTGYSVEEAIGENPRILKSQTTESDIYQDLWKTITAGKEWHGEFQNRKKNGELFWVYANISPIFNSNGKITHFIALNEDITERKILQQQLNQSQKMESIGNLAGGIAHDFNNLLTIINGYSDIALKKIKKKDPLFTELTAIRTAGERAGDLTRQILAFSRKQIYQPKIVNINKVISEIQKLLKRLLGEDISILMNLEPDLWNIKADPGQIEQIFMNLVVNARDAINEKKSPASEKKITIETGQKIIDKKFVANHMGSNTGPHVYFSVSDTGIGMDEKTQNMIFEPFYTTKEKGTGLGLATVYGIVKQNNGSIYLYSEPGSGATFKIYWPAAEGSSEAEAKVTDDDELRGSAVVLLVEDDIDILKFARTTLKEFGYRVLSAESGKKALKIAQKENFKIDLLLTDLVMPDMNGKELSEKIVEKAPHVKLLFASGYTDNHLVHSGKLHRGINFLQKPYSIQNLLASVKKVLQQN